MGTSCTTAILKKDGTVEQVYINHDGHIYYNGAMLLLHYREPKKVKQLISFGNISTLGREVHPGTDSHSFDTPEKNVTVFYGRDRKEKGQQPGKFDSFDDFLKVGSFDDFNYLFDEKKGKWFTLNPDSNFIKDMSTMKSKMEKPKPLMRAVKAEFSKLNSEFKEEFLLYEKEMQALKNYKKLKKELSQKEEPAKKMKI